MCPVGRDVCLSPSHLPKASSWALHMGLLSAPSGQCLSPTGCSFGCWGETVGAGEKLCVLARGVRHWLPPASKPGARSVPPIPTTPQLHLVFSGVAVRKGKGKGLRFCALPWGSFWGQQVLGLILRGGDAPGS